MTLTGMMPLYLRLLASDDGEVQPDGFKTEYFSGADDTSFVAAKLRLVEAALESLGYVTIFESIVMPQPSLRPSNGYVDLEVADMCLDCGTPGPHHCSASEEEG